jgi:asparagine synthase (glutamine-hydrolysing)
MPGIVGLITKLPRGQAEPQLLRMVEELHHEPFYTKGTWIDESSGLYVGWVARQNSFSDNMPLCNERKDVVLVFSGEEYPAPEVVRQIKAAGHNIAPHCAAYLVHLYEEDPTFPAGLNGRFQGLVADLSNGTATLFNDRFGMHRIYYYSSDATFYFAAEAKAILAVRPELREADARGLGEFVACGCVLENRTLFKDLNILPPAAAWVFQRGLLQRKSTYFDPKEWENQTPLEAESYYQEIKDIFSRNISRYFSGQERIGMSLTGGLDTRMIMAWQKSPPGSLICYTFGGMFRDCRDVRVARQVARACGQPHAVIRVGEEFLTRFSHYAERTVYLTDGCMNVSHSPDLYVNELAQEIAPVRMTGNYGDEVLRRIRVFKPVAAAVGLFCPEFMTHVQQAGQTYVGLVQGHPLSFSVFRQAPWHHYGLLALEQTQLSLRTPYLDNELVRMVFRAPEIVFADNNLRIRLIEDGNPELKKIRTDLGFAGARVNFFSEATRRLHNFTHKAEYAYDYGMPQWVARIDHCLSAFHLERLFLGRHKFYHFRIWYRDALAKYIQEMLLDRRALARPYLDRQGLENMVNGHIKGDSNHTIEIHKVLTLELLHRLFIDPK